MRLAVAGLDANQKGPQATGRLPPPCGIMPSERLNPRLRRDFACGLLLGFTSLRPAKTAQYSVVKDHCGNHRFPLALGRPRFTSRNFRIASAHLEVNQVLSQCCHFAVKV